jgi:hypothetical protein
MKTPLCVVALALIAISCTSVPKNPPKASPMDSAEECAAHNGDWVPMPELYPDKVLSAEDSKRYICNIRTHDGGKPCTGNKDCEGTCMAPDGAIPGKPAVGSCSSHMWIVEGKLAIHKGVVDYPLYSDEMTPEKAARLRELEFNRSKWKAQQISNYSITMEETDCYCLFGPYYGPIENTIRNGKIESAVYLGEVRDGYRPGDLVKIPTNLKRTVEQLFDDLERTILKATSNTKLQIEYDNKYGFPALVAYDRPDWHDDQSRVVVLKFKPARNPR